MRVVVLARCTVLGVALSFASCGGSDDAGPGPSPTPPPGGASTTVDIVGELGSQSFDPNPASPGPARTVAWRNTHGVVHRIVANDESFDTGNIAAGATSGAITIPAEGINYHCSLHPGMIGAITGTGGTAPPCMGIYCEDN